MCKDNNLIVRAIITKGNVVSIKNNLKLTIEVNKAFDINTAIISAFAGEYAHLPGSIFIDGFILKEIKIKQLQKYIVDSKGYAFEIIDICGNWIPLTVKSKPSGPAYEYYKIQ